MITIIAVIAAKETARTSLDHDRVLDEATRN